MRDDMAETLEAIKRRALVITAEIEAKTGPYSAEIAHDCVPQWHIITTEPGAEDRVLRRLSERGFGVYLPCFDRAASNIARGPIFPRHLFVFVWDVLRHWRRLRECPGVTAILARDEEPVVMPDKDIARIQMMEASGLAYQLSGPTKRSRRRRRPGERCETEQLGMTISCKSYWDQVPGLAPEARIGVLHRALGL